MSWRRGPRIAKTFRVGFMVCSEGWLLSNEQQTSSQRDNLVGRMGPHPPVPCYSAQARDQAKSGDSGQSQLDFRSLGTFMVMKQVQGKAGESVYRSGSGPVRVIRVRQSPVTVGQVHGGEPAPGQARKSCLGLVSSPAGPVARQRHSCG